MKNKFKWGGLLSLVGFLGLAGSASATPIDFSFTNIGSIDSVTSCGFGCNSVQTSGDLWVGGAVVGSFEGTMKVLGFGVSEVTDASTWSFVDNSSLNSLFGTLSGDLVGLLKGFIVGGGGALDYSVNGGTGFFTGATGTGNSVFGFSGSSYIEHGQLSVDTAPVPEPGVATLLLAGFGMVGFLAYRRRRASTQI
jgi:hypothetical protein